MKKREVERLSKVTEDLLEFTDDMDDQSAKFVKDMAERFDQYDDRTFVSEKQEKWLLSLEEKFL